MAESDTSVARGPQLLREAVRLLRERKAEAGLLAATAVVAGALYGPHLGSIVAKWLSSDVYYHCPVVPLASLYVLWFRRGDLARTPGGTWWFGLLPTTIGALLYVAFRVIGGGEVWIAGSLFFAILGLALTWSGRERARLLWFPLLFLVFAIPLPGSVLAAAGFPLQKVAAGLTQQVASAVGLPVERHGLTLVMGGFVATVAQACSGMHSLFALAMCGSFIVGSAQLGWWRKLLLFATMGPAVILGNVLRLVVMLVVALFLGAEAALGFFHEASGVMLFLLVTAVLLMTRSALEGKRVFGPPAAGRSVLPPAE